MLDVWNKRSKRDIVTRKDLTSKAPLNEHKNGKHSRRGLLGDICRGSRVVINQASDVS